MLIGSVELEQVGDDLDASVQHNPPAPIWPTQYTMDMGCNLWPLRQWGDATPLLCESIQSYHQDSSSVEDSREEFLNEMASNGWHSFTFHLGFVTLSKGTQRESVCVCECVFLHCLWCCRETRWGNRGRGEAQSLQMAGMAATLLAPALSAVVLGSVGISQNSVAKKTSPPVFLSLSGTSKVGV